MTPTQLFDTAMDVIDCFNRGEYLSDEPKVLLVIPTANLPKGEKIPLFGKNGGPRGDICNIKRVGGGYETVAYFPAVGIIQALGKMTGTKVKVRRK